LTLPLFKAYRFIEHWLKAVDEHSMHAPFIYSFYTEIVKKDYLIPEFERIESLRKQLLKSTGSIEVCDMGAGSRVNKGRRKSISEIARHELSSAKFSRLLYRIIQHYKPQNIIELGTSLGINTLYMASADEKTKIITIEGCPNTAAKAAELFKECNSNNIKQEKGNIDSLFPDILDNLQVLGLMYIDANHTLQATLKYFELALTKITENSILIFDDIHWSNDMEEAWKVIKSNEKVADTLDLFEAGLVFFRSGLQKNHFKAIF